MVLRRLSLAAVALSGGVFGVAQPAQAMAGVGSMPIAISMAAFGTSRDCPSVVAPAIGAASAPFASASKASAILGGQPSRLEMIAQQQAAAAAPARVASVSAPAASTALQPGAGLGNCQSFAPSFVAPTPALGGLRPGLHVQPLGEDDFLGSRRLSVSRTSFDASWNRIRDKGLPKGTISSLGRVAHGQADRNVLSAVNAWANARIRYVEDRALYGQADYWASADMTLRRGAGDCEDIAIAKMQILAAVGVPRSQMYLTIARDLARRADHALLVVKLDGRHWLLDNSTDTLLDAAESYDYRPILSFSNGNKWLHGY